MTISGYAWNLGKQFSRLLVERGEQPLGNDELTRCAPCASTWNERTIARSDEEVRRISQLFELAKQGHPYDPDAYAGLKKRGYSDEARRYYDLTHQTNKPPPPPARRRGPR